MNENGKHLLDVFLQEYGKLKDEQANRIGFRDNLLYVTITVYGAIAVFAFKDTPIYHALLVLPWVSLILGWTYLVNDEKISAIGKYIREDITEKIESYLKAHNEESTLGWEIEHRSDEDRKRRKVEQLIVDLSAFILPGFASLFVYWAITPGKNWVTIILSVFEFLAIIVLCIEFINYADLQTANQTSSNALKALENKKSVAQPESKP
jgi:hypothetical protein